MLIFIHHETGKGIIQRVNHNKEVLRTWTFVKGCDPEMICMTFNDHNLHG